MRNPKRSPYAFFEDRRLRWIKEGRGQGSGAEYRPWLEVRDVKSSGRKSRMRGILHDRVMHLMSDLERNAVLYFERQPQVTDIREQFPLDRDITRRIAHAMGVSHPRDPWTGEDIVMTSDVVVDFRIANGKTISRVFSVKQSEDLLKHRTVVKQEIERRYWTRFGHTWKPLLDCTLRRTQYFNALMWAREWFYLPIDAGVPLAVWTRRCELVEAALVSGEHATLRDLVACLEQEGGFGSGDVLSTLRHLIARQRIAYDFNLGEPSLDMVSSTFSACALNVGLAA